MHASHVKVYALQYAVGLHPSVSSYENILSEVSPYE